MSPPKDYGVLEVAAHLTVRTGGFNPDSNLVIVRSRAQNEPARRDSEPSRGA